MSDRIEYSPEEIKEVGEQVCPDIANFYDDIGSKAAKAGRSRDSAFGDHPLAGVFNDLHELFYEIIYETGENMRALGPTLVAIAADQEILEGELARAFEEQESEIEENGYASETSESFDSTPSQAPAPEDKDENPYADQLITGPDQPV